MKLLNKETKIFLMVFLILGIGFLSTNLEITGNTHLVKTENKYFEDLPTELTINSYPPKADIYISGNYIGQTPLTLTALDPTLYEIELRKIGYYNLKEKINLEANIDNVIRLDLTKIGEGSLFIDSNIKEADIYINNELSGITPKKISLLEGVYDIKIRKNNFADFFTSKAIKAGQNDKLFANLDNKNSGSMYVETEPNDAKILVDDVYQGVTPNLLGLNTGSYIVRVEKEGYDSKTFNVEIKENERKDIIAKLDASLGTLFVGSEPFGAKIYIDGTYQGVTPKIVSGLGDGFHTLKITKDYYEEYLGTIKVKRLYPNSIYVKLVRK